MIFTSAKEELCHHSILLQTLGLQRYLVQPQSVVNHQLRPDCSGLCSLLKTSKDRDGMDSLGDLLPYLTASQ